MSSYEENTSQLPPLSITNQLLEMTDYDMQQARDDARDMMKDLENEMEEIDQKYIDHRVIIDRLTAENRQDYRIHN